MRATRFSPSSRVLLSLTASAGLLAVSSAQPSAEAVGSAALDPSLRPTPRRPLRCDAIRTLGLDFRNDLIDVPVAFDLKVGEVLSGRSAKFHLYALAEDPRFFTNITTQLRDIDIRVRPPMAGSDVGRRVIYSQSANDPTFQYFSSRGGVEDRLAFVDFSFRCKSPGVTFRDRYMLTIRGTGRPLSAAQNALLEAQDRQETMPSEPALMNSASPRAPAEDCCFQNSYSLSSEQGVSTPQPDLTGSWQRASIGSAPPLLRPHYAVRGKLQIRNDGEVETAPTRLVLFLSADKTAGPEDRLLGFADVEALPAGVATEVAVNYGFQSAPWVGEKHLIALVDSSNTDYEGSERNNWIVSEPLR